MSPIPVRFVGCVINRPFSPDRPRPPNAVQSGSTHSSLTRVGDAHRSRLEMPPSCVGGPHLVHEAELRGRLRKRSYNTTSRGKLPPADVRLIHLTKIGFSRPGIRWFLGTPRDPDSNLPRPPFHNRWINGTRYLSANNLSARYRSCYSGAR